MCKYGKVCKKATDNYNVYTLHCRLHTFVRWRWWRCVVSLKIFDAQMFEMFDLMKITTSMYVEKKDQTNWNYIIAQMFHLVNGDVFTMVSSNIECNVYFIATWKGWKSQNHSLPMTNRLIFANFFFPIKPKHFYISSSVGFTFCVCVCDDQVVTVTLIIINTHKRCQFFAINPNSLTWATSKHYTFAS